MRRFLCIAIILSLPLPVLAQGSPGTFSGTFAGSPTLSGTWNFDAPTTGLTVTNNATVGGALIVSGVSSLIGGGTFAGSWAGTLNLTGTGLNASGNAAIGGTLNVTGLTTLSGGLGVGSGTITGSPTATGAWSFTGGGNLSGAWGLGGAVFSGAPTGTPDFRNMPFASAIGTPITYSGAVCNGTTDDTSAIQTLLNALPAGATIIGPAGVTCTVQSANLTIPPGVSIIGAGSPLGATSVAPASATFTLEVAPSHTIIMSSGTELKNFEVKRYGLTTNPTAAQVEADHAIWLADRSTGVLIDDSAQGVLIQNMFIMGFHFGVFATPGNWEVDSLYGDDSTLIYSGPVGDYAKVDYARDEPWECINSANCGYSNQAAWADYGTAFYFVGPPFISHLGCEFFATCYELANPAGAHFSDATAESVSAVVPYNSGNTAPQNGWGSDGVRIIGGGGPAATFQNIQSHWFSLNVADDSDTGLTYSDSELSLQDTAGPALQGAMSLWTGGNNSVTGNVLTFGGAPTNGSTISVTISGAATPPRNPNLSQTSGGALAATPYYVELTCGTSSTETTAGPEKSFSVAANNLLTETYPPPQPGCMGYNVYVGTSSGSETKQNASLIAYGTNWTEPTSGLISGASPPGSNNTSWSTTDSYAAGSVPGLPESTVETIPLMVEYSLNTDHVLQGYHIGAFYGAYNVSLFEPAGAPTVTVTVSATGGLTVTQSTQELGPSNPSAGIISNPTIITQNGGQFPLLFTAGTGDAWWTLEGFGGNSGGNFPYNGWAVGLNSQDVTFGSMYWGLLGGNGGGSVSGTGCSFGGSQATDKNNRFVVTQAAGSTGCSVTFSYQWPVPPVCIASVSGSTPIALGLATETGISWTNASLSGTQYTTVMCEP